MENITVTELKERLEQSNDKPLLLDVREPWEFAICHIDGSRLIPMREIPNAVGELDEEQEIVVICHTGVRSLQVCYFLQHEGFSNVSNLSGGVHAWATTVDPQMPTY
ncbi:MAG: rhodanese-like domain-containing protein [Gammaproteobacteria bacterium]|jgi:rhodanese-related sulfurtransferase